MAKNDNLRKRKKAITYVADDDLAREIQEYIKLTGIRQSDLNRRAIRKYMDEGHQEALLTLNVIQLVQVVNDIQEEVTPDNVKQLKHLTENLIKIRGGR